MRVTSPLVAGGGFLLNGAHALRDGSDKLPTEIAGLSSVKYYILTNNVTSDTVLVEVAFGDGSNSRYEVVLNERGGGGKKSKIGAVEYAHKD